MERRLAGKIGLQCMSAALTFALASSAAGAWEYHTRPSCWAEPRVFHAEDGHRYRELEIERVEGALSEEAVLSPNGAYRMQVVFNDLSDRPTWDGEMLIDNERPYLLRLVLPDLSWPHSAEARWINEKLVFVRAWWGRVAGTDLVIDVERESIVLEENVYDGGQAFKQFEVCTDQERAEEERCRCFPGAPEGWSPHGGEELPGEPRR